MIPLMAQMNLAESGGARNEDSRQQCRKTQARTAAAWAQEILIEAILRLSVHWATSHPNPVAAAAGGVATRTAIFTALICGEIRSGKVTMITISSSLAYFLIFHATGRAWTKTFLHKPTSLVVSAFYYHY